MNDLVIQVEQLGKLYRIGRARERHDTLRDALVATMRTPLDRLHRNGHTRDTVEEATIWALKDVSFSIERGQVVGVIGRNGAGKSTLLKILCRITEPTEGRVEIQGRVGSLLEVGTGFHPELTGRENVFLNGAILGMRKTEIEKRFDEIVDFAEIGKFIDTPVKRYSSGMFVRLAFAVAAHLEPEILFVDEVLAVGDAQFQQKCLGKIGEVAEGGRTVLFVSHNMQSVRRLCSQAIFLETGFTEGLCDVEAGIQRYFADSPVSAPDVDLASIERTGGIGQKVRLLRLRVAPDSSFSYGQPLRLVFTIECRRPVSELAIGMGFETLGGSRILTLDSDNAQRPMELDPGVYEVAFDMGRNPLHPGLYTIHASLMSNRYVLDRVPNAATWEVISGASDRVGDRGFGGCRLPIDVSITKVGREGALRLEPIGSAANPDLGE